MKKSYKNYATRTLYFAEQKTGSCCYMEFIGVFLKLINIYIVT